MSRTRQVKKKRRIYNRQEKGEYIYIIPGYSLQHKNNDLDSRYNY